MVGRCWPSPEIRAANFDLLLRFAPRSYAVATSPALRARLANPILRGTPLDMGAMQNRYGSAGEVIQRHLSRLRERSATPHLLRGSRVRAMARARRRLLVQRIIGSVLALTRNRFAISTSCFATL